MTKNRKHRKSAPKTKNNPVVAGLTHLLADTYVLYVKTQNFHWNVLGPHFYSYHKLFDEQYNALAEAVDLLAERIRALKAHTPASLATFLSLTGLHEADDNLGAEEMLQVLLLDHEYMSKLIVKLFAIAQKAGDEVTLDILIARKTEHDKTAWMLRSTLGLE